MSRKKYPSKRRIKARLRIGREVPMLHLIYHDIDSEETIAKYHLYLDWDRDTAQRIGSSWRSM